MAMATLQPSTRPSSSFQHRPALPQVDSTEEDAALEGRKEIADRKGEEEEEDPPA